MANSKSIPATLTATVLIAGTIALASAAPLWVSPAAGELPVITIDRPIESAATSAGVTPPVHDSPAAVPSASDTDGVIREVVRPAVRDDDAEEPDDDAEEPDDDAEEPDDDAEEPDDDAEEPDDDAEEPDDD